MNIASKVLRSPVLWLLVVALALRLAACAWWEARLPEGRLFAFADSESYWSLAGKIARGEPYEFGDPPAAVFRTPGYPLLLAGMFRVYGDEPPVMAARVMSALLGACSVAGVYALARRLFDARTALCAAAIVAFYPGAIAISVLVLSEALFCPLLVGHLVLLVAAWQSTTSRPTIIYALCSGAIAGAATLVRPSWLLFVPFTLALGMMSMRSVSRHATIGALSLAGLILVMAPWWVRNYRVTGHLVPTTLQVGASLYDGLSAQATGASEMSFVPKFVALETQEPAADDPLEYRLDRRMRTASLEWAAAHPGRVVQLAAIKFMRLWNVWPNEAEFRSWPLRLAVAATYLPVMCLAIWGAFCFVPRGWPYVICLLPAAYVTVLHLVFVSSIRYRDPAMLPLAVLASGALLHRGPAIDHTEKISTAGFT